MAVGKLPRYIGIIGSAERNGTGAPRGTGKAEKGSMAKLKAGLRLKSAVCNTEVMVVAAPDAEIEVTCGGAPLIELGAASQPGVAIAEGAAAGTLIGKRYVSAAGDLELLCTKPGKGSLGARGELLAVKGAKPLPSSD